jgi:hypothetical protein
MLTTGNQLVLKKALNDLIFTFNKTKQVERKINSATILQILREAFPTAEKKKEKTAENKKIKEQNETITDKDKKIKKVTTFSDYARLTLTLLYNAKIFETLRCFKNDTNEDEEILIRDFKGDINIFGEKYSLKTRKDLILKEEKNVEPNKGQNNKKMENEEANKEKQNKEANKEKQNKGSPNKENLNKKKIVSNNTVGDEDDIKGFYEYRG